MVPGGSFLDFVVPGFATSALPISNRINSANYYIPVDGLIVGF